MADAGAGSGVLSAGVIGVGVEVGVDVGIETGVGAGAAATNTDAVGAFT